MNLHQKVFARVFINGKTSESMDFGHIELRVLPTKFAQFIINHPMESRDLSSLELRSSKRPITEEKVDPELAKLIEAAGDEIRFVGGDEPVEELGGLSWNQYEECSNDPVWINMVRLGNTVDLSNYIGIEIEGIVTQFATKYQHTIPGARILAKWHDRRRK